MSSILTFVLEEPTIVKSLIDFNGIVSGTSIARVVLTGDFNVDQTSPSYKVINDSDVLTDAYDKTNFLYGPSGTFNGFNINTNSDKRIDHIFVSKEIQVLKHGILSDVYHSNKDVIKDIVTQGDFPKELELAVQKARTPSDHYPICIVVKLNSNKAE
ncbi:Endonuclease/Exonuclease/phosphatase family protein [Pustulibacterium marinum]|uniref:Endonuclease/Exonuclease/phosphatase family protein n=1 Tax=Pustulibacterium marinum TaxID=1224947 RepID=A0A1I7GFD5_9FLAO|nr:endonuclease/exonuclease/phosphatase family protein [Pustulibacterium marinum]SFU47140.1 Endonuclease/Exonuclease/phosphatase family protein [Pustulibacterium marinum]